MVTIELLLQLLWLLNICNEYFETPISSPFSQFIWYYKWDEIVVGLYFGKFSTKFNILVKSKIIVYDGV